MCVLHVGLCENAQGLGVTGSTQEAHKDYGGPTPETAEHHSRRMCLDAELLCSSRGSFYTGGGGGVRQTRDPEMGRAALSIMKRECHKSSRLC